MSVHYKTKISRRLTDFGDIFKHIAGLFYFFRRTHITPTFFFVSVICSSLAVFFNLLSFRLLVPLLQGLIQGDFKTAGDRLHVIRYTAKIFPGLARHSVFYFLTLMGIILISILIKGALEYTSALSVGEQIRRADRLIRKQVIEQYLSFSKAYYDEVHAVKVTDIILNAAAGVTKQLMSLHGLLSKFLLLSAYLAILLWISWPLTLIALIIFPAVSFLSRRLVSQIKDLAQNHDDQRDQLMEKVMGVISCIPLVKSYAWESAEAEKLTSISDEEIHFEYELQKKELLFEPIQDISMMLALLLMACTIVFLGPSRDPAKVPLYLVFFYVVRLAMRHVNVLADFKISMARADVQLLRLKELLMPENRWIFPVCGKQEFDGLKKEIEFSHLNFSYAGKQPVLHDISFKIRKGAMTAVIGATGAGKSTLAHLLMRFYDCPPNSILIDGKDIREFTLASLMHRVAFVGQDAMLFNDTLRANITYGMKKPADDQKIFAALQKAQLHEAVAQWPKGLDTIIGDRGVQLSGGEKQRTALARAFLKEADILIFDEATSALDSKTEQLIQQITEKNIAGKTSIVIAHRLSTIRTADHVVVLDSGRIVEQGSLNELLEAGGRLSEYWRSQGLDKLFQSNEATHHSKG